MNDIQNQSNGFDVNSNEFQGTNNFGNPSVEQQVQHPFDMSMPNGNQVNGNQNNQDNNLVPQFDANGQPNVPINQNTDNNQMFDPVMEARNWQSKYDKTIAELTNTKLKAEENLGAYNLVKQLMEDPNVAKAFVSKFHSDLIPQQDIDSYVANQLAKEFPDFEPDPNQANVPGKHLRYYERARQLYGNFGNDNNVSFDELVQRREIERKAQAEENSKQLMALQQTFGVDENYMRGFSEFWKNQQPKDLMNIYRYLQNTHSRMVPPSTLPTGNTSSMGGSNELRTFLNSFKS